MPKASKAEDGDGNSAITIAEWPRNSREKVRVSLTEYHGHDLIDIRIWYLAEDDNYKAGKTGINLNVSQLPQLSKALEKALKRAKKLGLLSAESAGDDGA